MTVVRTIFVPLVLQVLVILIPVATQAQTCDGALPSVIYKGSSTTISQDAQKILEAVANQIKDHPACKAKVSGNGSFSKNAQQLSWDRVNMVIKYLVERQGIAENRLIFNYGAEGDPNIVDLLFTTEDGPQMVPPPHPYLRKITLSDLGKKPAIPKKKPLPKP